MNVAMSDDVSRNEKETKEEKKIESSRKLDPYTVRLSQISMYYMLCIVHAAMLNQ